MNLRSFAWILWLLVTLLIGLVCVLVLELPIFISLALAALCGMAAPLDDQPGPRGFAEPPRRQGGAR